MKLKCLQCGYEFTGSVEEDKLGWYSSCLSCNGSFDVDFHKPSREEISNYFKIQGYSLDDKLNPIPEVVDEFLNPPAHQNQYWEAVVNNYDLCDFDRWIKIQKTLFGDNEEYISFECAMEIAHALYEENYEVLDLNDFTEDNLKGYRKLILLRV